MLENPSGPRDRTARSSFRRRGLVAVTPLLQRCEEEEDIVTETQVLEGAEAFRLGDGPVGVLMVHGFTGSPQSLRDLGEFLAANGMTVEGIRLPGHGTRWQDLNTVTADDWRAAVRDGYERISADREEVFIVALSFGAALSIEFVADHPDAVKGMITLAGFVHTDDPRRFLAPLVARLTPSVAGVANDIAHPERRELAYDRLPTRGSTHMLKVLKSARTLLPQVRCPILVMHGRNDHTVKPVNAEIIHSSVTSEDKELVWLERSYHVITLDNDQDELHRRTLEFIKEHSAHGF